MTEYPPDLCTDGTGNGNGNVPLGQRLRGLLDAVLVADVFLVLAGAVWFGVAVLLQGRGVTAPLTLFQRLWQPLFTPAIGLLMAAALISGALGWWRRRGRPPAPGTGN